MQSTHQDVPQRNGWPSLTQTSCNTYVKTKQRMAINAHLPIMTFFICKGTLMKILQDGSSILLDMDGLDISTTDQEVYRMEGDSEDESEP